MLRLPVNSSLAGRITLNSSAFWNNDPRSSFPQACVPLPVPVEWPFFVSCVFFSFPELQRMSQHYDVIVIGGGHNGLVNPPYLAQAGKKGLVLERRHVLGGAAVTEEIFPRF